MDELFAELLHVDTDGEKAFAKVQLKKQFTTVTLDFKDAENGRTDYDIIVKGNIQGTDYKTLEPKDGPFRCIPEAAPERGYQFRVPRQKDNSLTAELWSEDALVDTIPVGLQRLISTGEGKASETFILWPTSLPRPSPSR